MKWTIKQGILKDFLGFFKPHVSEIKLIVDREGIEVRTVDPAHVLMIIGRLKVESFDTFEIGNDNVEIGIDLVKIDKILGLAKRNDLIKVELDGENLVFYMHNLSRTTKTEDIANMEDPKEPQIDLSSKVVMYTKELFSMIKGAADLQRYCRLTIDDNAFYVYTDNDTEHVDYKVTQDNYLELDSIDGAVCNFSTDYLKKIFKSIEPKTRGLNVVTVWIGNDYPTRIETDNEHYELRFLLAPRMDDETPYNDSGPEEETKELSPEIEKEFAEPYVEPEPIEPEPADIPEPEYNEPEPIEVPEPETHDPRDNEPQLPAPTRDLDPQILKEIHAVRFAHNNDIEAGELIEKVSLWFGRDPDSVQAAIGLGA